MFCKFKSYFTTVAGGRVPFVPIPLRDVREDGTPDTGFGVVEERQDGSIIVRVDARPDDVETLRIGCQDGTWPGVSNFQIEPVETEVTPEDGGPEV